MKKAQEKKEKKNIIFWVVFTVFAMLLIVLSGLAYRTVNAYIVGKKCSDSLLKFQEYNSENIFSINKITYFSSANAKIETNSNSSFTVSGLYQYTDIAIFLNPNSETLTSKNTLKSVVISDIKFSVPPSAGKPNLYYKKLSDFATPKFSTDNLIKDSITFETTSENKIDYSKPILYNNCANPITLCYVNSNIQKDYTLSNNVSNIAHNGALLKSCGITLNSISCKISFNVTITNNLDETYTCPVTLNIPLSTENSTVYDGSLTLKDATDYNFIRAQ